MAAFERQTVAAPVQYPTTQEKPMGRVALIQRCGRGEAFVGVAPEVVPSCTIVVGHPGFVNQVCTASAYVCRQSAAHEEAVVVQAFVVGKPAEAGQQFCTIRQMISYKTGTVVAVPFKFEVWLARPVMYRLP